MNTHDTKLNCTRLQVLKQLWKLITWVVVVLKHPKLVKSGDNFEDFVVLFESRLLYLGKLMSLVFGPKAVTITLRELIGKGNYILSVRYWRLLSQKIQKLQCCDRATFRSLPCLAELHRSQENSQGWF